MFVFRQEKEVILREQQQAIMRPVVYALRRVQLITATSPDTPHERWFSENIQPLIEQGLEQLQKPPNPHSPQSCWSGFKQVIRQHTPQYHAKANGYAGQCN